MISLPHKLQSSPEAITSDPRLLYQQHIKQQQQALARKHADVNVVADIITSHTIISTPPSPASSDLSEQQPESEQQKEEEEVTFDEPVRKHRFDGCVYFDCAHSNVRTVVETLQIPQETRRKGPRGGVAIPFPVRLHAMLETPYHPHDEETMTPNDIETIQSIVSWQPHGRSFRIVDVTKFVEFVMPRYFQQTKFTSFQRQLNLYGYQRVTAAGVDQGTYYHELFIRGRPDLCKIMIRVRAPPSPNAPTKSLCAEKPAMVIMSGVPVASTIRTFFDIPSAPEPSTTSTMIDGGKSLFIPKALPDGNNDSSCLPKDMLIGSSSNYQNCLLKSDGIVICHDNERIESSNIKFGSFHMTDDHHDDDGNTTKNLDIMFMNDHDQHGILFPLYSDTALCHEHLLFTGGEELFDHHHHQPDASLVSDESSESHNSNDSDCHDNVGDDDDDDDDNSTHLSLGGASWLDDDDNDKLNELDFSMNGIVPITPNSSCSRKRPLEEDECFNADSSLSSSSSSSSGCQRRRIMMEPSSSFIPRKPLRKPRLPNAIVPMNRILSV